MDQEKNDFQANITPPNLENSSSQPENNIPQASEEPVENSEDPKEAVEDKYTEPLFPEEKTKKTNSQAKKILILFIILVVLILIVIFVGNPNLEKSKLKNLLQSPLIEDFQKDQVKKIVIKNGEDVSLVNRGGEWIIESINFAAQGFAVTQLLDNLEKATGGQIVSKNAERQSEYELIEEQAKKLELYNGDNEKISELLIGKAGPIFPSTYVRYQDSNEIILTNVSFLSFIDKKIADWRDKEITKFDPTQAQKIYIKRLGYKEILIEKTNDTWLLTRPYQITPTDQEMVNTIITTLSGLQSVGFADDKTPVEVGLEDELTVYLNLNVVLDSGETYSLWIGNLDDEKNQYYAQNPDKGETIYMLTKGVVEGLDKQREEFRKVEE